jgi:hypothetical protein
VVVAAEHTDQEMPDIMEEPVRKEESVAVAPAVLTVLQVAQAEQTRAVAVVADFILLQMLLAPVAQE